MYISRSAEVIPESETTEATAASAVATYVSTGLIPVTNSTLTPVPTKVPRATTDD